MAGLVFKIYRSAYPLKTAKLHIASNIVLTICCLLITINITADELSNKNKTGSVNFHEVKFMYDDTTFEQVLFNSNSKNACSPKITDYNWLGIKINAPGIIYSKNKKLHVFPVCALLQVAMPSVPTKKDSIRVELTDIISKKVFIGDIKDINTDPSPIVKPNFPKRKITPEKISKLGSILYKTINLKEQLIFPDTNAAYDLRLLFRGLISNTVRVEIKSLN